MANRLFSALGDGRSREWTGGLLAFLGAELERWRAARSRVIQKTAMELRCDDTEFEMLVITASAFRADGAVVSVGRRLAGIQLTGRMSGWDASVAREVLKELSNMVDRGLWRLPEVSCNRLHGKAEVLHVENRLLGSAERTEDPGGDDQAGWISGDDWRKKRDGEKLVP